MKFLKNRLTFRPLLVLICLLNTSNIFCQTLKPKYISTTPLSNGYYEYLPQGYDSTSNKTYPLLLCFGGYGENGDGSPAQLPYVINVWGTTGWQINQGIFPTSFTVNGQNYKFIILFPQFTNVATPQSINDIIDYAILHYRVDVIRIYMTGFSLGGGLIWDYTGNNIVYANRVAAIVPVCGGSYGDTTKAETIAAGNIAVWATHNDKDPTVPVDTTTIAYINLINSASTPPNPLAKMTIFHDNSHNAWDSTYNLSYGLHVYEWMLQYKRGPGTLPVTGMEFTAGNKNNNEVLLRWKTYTENNNRGFVIERSINGLGFDSIGYAQTRSMAGKGAEYSFTDASPYSGKNYYRLRQVDFYNNTKYSLVKIVETKKINAFKISPNPVKNELNIIWQLPVEQGQLNIWNSNGQLLQRYRLYGNSHMSIPIRYLSNGVYTAEIIDGNFSSKLPFLKQ